MRVKSVVAVQMDSCGLKVRFKNRNVSSRSVQTNGGGGGLRPGNGARHKNHRRWPSELKINKNNNKNTLNPVWKLSRLLSVVRALRATERREGKRPILFLLLYSPPHLATPPRGPPPGVSGEGGGGCPASWTGPWRCETTTTALRKKRKHMYSFIKKERKYHEIIQL